MQLTLSSRVLLVGGLALSIAQPGLAQKNRASSKLLPPTRVVRDFKAGWHFTWNDPPQAEEPGFDDHAWTSVTLPHDASIAGPVDKANASGQGGGFFPTGVVWYRKSFTLANEGATERTYVAFDGVMANSDVWINGFHLGHRPNGYVSFYYDLTAHIRPGVNVIAVRCDTSKQPASRWYEGLGISRSVRLVRTADVHIEPWSTFVSTPQVSAERAAVQVQSIVDNDSGAAKHISLLVTLTAPDGRVVRSIETASVPIGPHASQPFNALATIANPRRWDLATPDLYTAHVQVLEVSNKRAIDEETQSFGVREFHFDPDTGFWLNGRNFKIYGAAVHIDGGAVGIAVPMAVWERRLTELRALGVNAIRTAHNPPSPEFLDLCDRMGFLVMDEMFDCWTVGKNPYDYHLDFDQWSLVDTRDTVRRDRNHPSIILYSAGNEIHDTPKAELAHRILASLIEVFYANDPTRPVTQALFRPNVSHDYDNGLADMLDVIGQNYREKEILAAHAARPTRKIIGTENTHDRNQWLAMRDHPEYSGQFLWTGVDYLGEAGAWPLIGNGAGLVDRTALPRAVGYERQSWWSAAPMVRMARRVAPDDATAVDPGYEATPPRFHQSLYLDWTPRNTAPHDETVEVYTNAEEVELQLNGMSLGRQKLHLDASPLIWTVPYAAGSLKAMAYKQGIRVAEEELRTAGAPARIVMTPQTGLLAFDRDSVNTVAVSIVDSAGVVVPRGSSRLRFSTEGPGQIVATDNGSLIDHDTFTAAEHDTFEGHAIVLVRATAASGAITLTASGDGLTPATLTLTAAPSNAPLYQRSF